jgi:REP element-mobilizing transposase RayT
VAGTYTNILLHLAFSTKHREPLITPDLAPRLHGYLGGAVRGEGGLAIEIGGMPDHVHLLVKWRPDEAVSTLLRNMKGGSSRWVHETFPEHRAFAWQEGYGAFSVSESQAEVVRAYIRNQTEHHRKRSFKEEFVALLDAHGVAYDAQLIWR